MQIKTFTKFMKMANFKLVIWEHYSEIGSHAFPVINLPVQSQP